MVARGMLMSTRGVERLGLEVRDWSWVLVPGFKQEKDWEALILPRAGAAQTSPAANPCCLFYLSLIAPKCDDSIWCDAEPSTSE